MTGDGDRADGGEAGEFIGTIDAAGHVGAGEVLGVVKEACEAAGGAAFVGDVEEKADALPDARCAPVKRIKNLIRRKQLS